MTLENLSSRGQHANAANTFRELLLYGVVPVVNENDTVAVEQLRIGDNDTLSAQVATLVQAQWLFLLTDVDALYTANPQVDPSATPIREVPDLWDLAVDTSTRGTEWGTGGMATKITAARIATAGGCNMGICHFAEPRNVLAILRGEKIGTVFHAAKAPVRGNKRWILSTPVRGEVWMDAGAVRAVRDRHCSLFSAGIIRTQGDFSPHDTVRLCDHEGREFARGQSNYSREDVERVKGMSSKTFMRELGAKCGQEEIVHRGSICLLVSAHTEEENGQAGEEDGEEHGINGGMSPAGLSRSATPAILSSDAAAAAVALGASEGPGFSDGGEVLARLRMLTERAEAEDEALRAELRAAMIEEREADRQAAATAAGVAGEDVNEAGWLPK